MNQLNKILLVALLSLYGCKGKTQKEAEKTIGNISSEIKTQEPGSVPDPEGIYMTAAIDGKKWVATTMNPDYSTNSNYKMIHGATEEYTIDFSIYKPQTGDKTELSEEDVINFMTEDDSYSGKKGSVVVTMADDYWIEGNFHFTATHRNSGKTMEVTNGFFRVATKDPGKK